MAMESFVFGSSSLLLPSQWQRLHRSSPHQCAAGASSRPRLNAALRTGHRPSDINKLGLSRRLQSTELGLSSFARSSSLFMQSKVLFHGVARQGHLDVRAQAGKGDSVSAAERVVAALGYFLPFFDGIQYGRYFFLQFPVAEKLVAPLFPLLSVYKGLPFSNFVAFFGLYLLVVRNPNFSRYVRFNTMQAVVLDVLLIFPTLVERTFAPRGGIGFELLVIFYNAVFLFLVACFLFGVVSCILGKTPRLPLVAEAADRQV